MDAAASRSMLERIGFTAPAAAVMVAADGQGLSSMDDFLMMDEEVIGTICRVVRKPGGRDDGQAVSAIAEANLKSMVYYIKHQDRISRTANFAGVTVPKVRKLKRQQELEKKHEDPEVRPDIDPKNWPKTLESVIEWFGGFRGVDNHPLSYVVRDDLEVPTMGGDPTMGTAGSKYTTHDQELIKRGAIIDPTGAPTTDPEKDGPFTDTYLSDRMKLWRHGASLFKNTEAWPYYKVGKKNEDGRMGSKSVWNHYLGPNNVDHMAASAEKLLAQSSYHGEKKSWNFEKFATMHMEQHNILESLVEHGYNGIDARSKVRFLNDGIKSTTLDAVKTRIMSDTGLRGDFPGCVTLYKDFIKQQGMNERQSLNISQVGTGGGGGGGNVVVEDRYYEREEWDKLSASQRAEVSKIRKARATSQNKGGGGGGREKKFSKSHVAKLEKKVKSQRRQLSAMNAQKRPAEKEDSGQSDSESSEEQNNRGHNSLTRQRKTKKKKKD